MLGCTFSEKYKKFKISATEIMLFPNNCGKQINVHVFDSSSWY